MTKSYVNFDPHSEYNGPEEEKVQRPKYLGLNRN